MWTSLGCNRIQGPSLRELWRYFRCELCRCELKLKLLEVKSPSRFWLDQSVNTSINIHIGLASRALNLWMSCRFKLLTRQPFQTISYFVVLIWAKSCYRRASCGRIQHRKWADWQGDTHISSEELFWDIWPLILEAT